MEKKNNENEAIKKRDEMIAKNLKLAKQNECPLRENSLESILVENRQYIMRAKHNKKYINFSKNKVLENLLQKLKDRWKMENQEYELNNQTDVTIGEKDGECQEETANQLAEEMANLQENEIASEDNVQGESGYEENLQDETNLQKENTAENEIQNLKNEKNESYQCEQSEDELLEIHEKPIGVYVKYDENGNIKEVNSDIFITDFTGWTKIDEGFGDRYAHAQSQYFLSEE